MQQLGIIIGVSEILICGSHTLGEFLAHYFWKNNDLGQCLGPKIELKDQNSFNF